MPSTSMTAEPASGRDRPASGAGEADGWRLIPTSDPDGWRDALDGLPHAFAHSWESCRAMELTTGHETHLVELRAGSARAVCPVARRPIGDAVDLVTPLGYSGFVGVGTCPDFPARWRRLARSLGAVSGYLTLHPLLDQARWHDPAERDCHQLLYALDLRPDEATLFAGLSRNRQRQLRAGLAPGERLVDDGPALRDFFARHFAEVMAARGASAPYRLAPAAVATLLDAPQTLLVGVEANGLIETATMFAHTAHVGESLFNVSRPEGRRHAAVVTWHGLRRLKRLGVPWLNLGGGVRPGDGIAKFKERFGARPLPLCALKQVYDPAAYEALCRAAGADPADRSGYFPAYRAS